MTVLAPAPATRPPLLSLVTPPPAPAPSYQPTLPLRPDPVIRPVAPAPHEAERVARSLTLAVCEALAGHRPLAQVRPVLAPEVVAFLVRWSRTGATGALRLRSCRFQSPRDGVVEVAARVSRPDGPSAALALRLERSATGWRVVASEFALGPDARRPARG